MTRAERVMGLPVGIAVRDPGGAPAAVEAAFAWLRHVDAVFSPYRENSDVSRLDRGALAPRDADPDVREVLARCEELRVLTGGAFDARYAGRLDPSGYVKGWAVDRAGALLERAGVRRYAINAGGDVRLRGGPWRVGIQHPREPAKLAEVLELDDGAVATSGLYERGPHIVDPRSGRVPEGVLSVTVRAADLASADAYATAAFAMGEAGPAWTAGLAGCEAMTILADGRVLKTEGF